MACSPMKPSSSSREHTACSDSFHVIFKVPAGDSPYVKAKYVQLVDKDPERAIALFWAALNAGDRVDSALKDMAIVMKQQNRPEEAIEAIKSLRSRCSDQAQEALDNVLLDLYKRCGRLSDQISLLKHKLHLISEGMAFNGKRSKTARCQGRKFQVSIEQETTRLLGNLGWAYMQQSNYAAAEAVYRKALSIKGDSNKVCNLGICLMKQGRLAEASAILQTVSPASVSSRPGSDSHLKSYERAQAMLRELDFYATSQLLDCAGRYPSFSEPLPPPRPQAQAQPQAQSQAQALLSRLRTIPQQPAVLTSSMPSFPGNDDTHLHFDAGMLFEASENPCMPTMRDLEPTGLRGFESDGPVGFGFGKSLTSSLGKADSLEMTGFELPEKFPLTFDRTNDCRLGDNPFRDHLADRSLFSQFSMRTKLSRIW